MGDGEETGQEQSDSKRNQCFFARHVKSILQLTGHRKILLGNVSAHIVSAHHKRKSENLLEVLRYFIIYKFEKQANNTIKGMTRTPQQTIVPCMGFYLDNIQLGITLECI